MYVYCLQIAFAGLLRGLDATLGFGQVGYGGTVWEKKNWERILEVFFSYMGPRAWLTAPHWLPKIMDPPSAVYENIMDRIYV